MPLKLTIGLSRKCGLPDYGSLGASCQLEMELDAALLSQDPVGLGDQARRAYVACSEAVADALQRHRPADPPHARQCAGAPNGRSAHRFTPTPATARQREYLQQLAAQIPGMDPSALEAFGLPCCGRALAELDRKEASQLIDALQQLAAANSTNCAMPSDASWHDTDAWQISPERESENGPHRANGAPDVAPAG